MSLEGYRELSQVEQSLSRAHVVQNYAKLLDNQWTVKRTPGEAQGAELPFKLLLQSEIRNYVSTNPFLLIKNNCYSDAMGSRGNRETRNVEYKQFN